MKYTHIETFHEGIAAAMFKRWGIFPCWHHINEAEQPLYPHSFIRVRRMHEGYSVARDFRGWFHINNKGEPLYSRRFSEIHELEAFHRWDLDDPAIGMGTRPGENITEVSLNRRSGKITFSDTGETVQELIEDTFDLSVMKVKGSA